MGGPGCRWARLNFRYSDGIDGARVTRHGWRGAPPLGGLVTRHADAPRLPLLIFSRFRRASRQEQMYSLGSLGNFIGWPRGVFVGIQWAKGPHISYL